VAAGIGWVTGGTITAHTGFSPQVSTVLLAASVLTAVFPRRRQRVDVAQKQRGRLSGPAVDHTRDEAADEGVT
jgi:hypothetical protein